MNLNELRDEAYSIAKANGWIPPRRKKVLNLIFKLIIDNHVHRNKK